MNSQQLAAPIVLFAFNRPDFLLRTLQALAANPLAEQSTLTIFCDGPRHERDVPNTNAVRRLAKRARGFAGLEVVERPRNLGCGASVKGGLQQMFAAYERCIVMEDDVLCSPHTLAYLNQGLERYQDEPAVMHISAWSPGHFPVPALYPYPYDVYAIPRFTCWGWGSWRDRVSGIDWGVSDFDEFYANSFLQRAYSAGGADLPRMLFEFSKGRLDTWDICFDYARFRHGRVGINPVRSYTRNIGSNCGTHTSESASEAVWEPHQDTDISTALPPTEAFRWLTHIAVDEGVREQFLRSIFPPGPLRPVEDQRFVEGMQEGRRLVVSTMAKLNIPEERISLLSGIEPGMVHSLIKQNQGMKDI